MVRCVNKNTMKPGKKDNVGNVVYVFRYNIASYNNIVKGHSVHTVDVCIIVYGVLRWSGIYISSTNGYPLLRIIEVINQQS